MLITENDITNIKEKCILYNVRNLYVFGSAATDNYTQKSDIDLLIDFEDIVPEDYVKYYFNIKDFLTEYFHRKIDLLELKALNNPYLPEEINKNKFLIYGKTN